MVESPISVSSHTAVSTSSLVIHGGLTSFLTAVKSSVAPSQYYLVWHKEREKTSMNFNGPFLGVRELLLYLKFRAKDYLSIHCI